MLNFSGEVISDIEEKILQKVFKMAMRECGQSYRRLEVNVDLVRDIEMRELNKRTRNIDKATDVLSYPYLENIFKKITKKRFPNNLNFESGKIMLGDISINLDKVEEQSKDYGHAKFRELAYLLVHGLLHLLGHDHMDEDDKLVMRELEERVLGKLKIKREG